MIKEIFILGFMIKNIYSDRPIYTYNNKSKININLKDKTISGYDYCSKYLERQEYTHFVAEQNTVYFVIESFDYLSNANYQIYNVNGYYDITNYNSYNFYFPFKEFTFSFKQTNISKDVFYFEFEYIPKYKSITLYNKDKKVIKSFGGEYGTISFRMLSMDEYFIKVSTKESEAININFIFYKYDNLYFLSQLNNEIKFPTINKSKCIFYIDITKIPENKIYFRSRWGSLEDTYVFYVYFNTTDLDEIKSTLPYITKRKNGALSTYVSYDKFEISSKKDYKVLIFEMSPKINATNFYVQAIFYKYNDMFIYGAERRSFYLNEKNHYYICNYHQKKYYNNDRNTALFINLENGDPDSSILLYENPNEFYVNDFRYKSGNLINSNWKNFWYSSGEIFFIVTNFKLIDEKSYTLTIFNNNEYYDISKYLNSYSNYSISIKFNKTKSQFLTFQIKPSSEYYIFFEVKSPEAKLNININITTDHNITILPQKNKYFKLNESFISYIDIIINCDKEFSEINMKIYKTNELPNNNYKLYYIIAYILLGIVQIILLVIFVIYILKKSKKQNNTNQGLNPEFDEQNTPDGNLIY